MPRDGDLGAGKSSVVARRPTAEKIRAIGVPHVGVWSRLTRLGVTLLAGGLFYASVPPVNWWWAAVPAFALFAWVLTHPATTLAGGAGYALVFGLALYVPLVPWAGAFAGTPPWLGLALLGAVFTPVFGMTAVAVRRLPGWPVRFALLWPVSEWLRSWVPFGGFPWGVVAAGQTGGPLLPVVRHAAPAGGPAITVAAMQGNVPRLGHEFNARRRAVLDNHVAETLRLADAVRAGRAPRRRTTPVPAALPSQKPLRRQRRNCASGARRRRCGANMDGMDVREVLLPSIGVRYEFISHAGDRIAIIARRGGDFEIVRYDRDDPDQARSVCHFTDEEADGVAQILGAPRIAERFTALTREVPGIDTSQVDIPPSSPFVDRPLGDTGARTRTGASIVAIVRNDEVIASPGPAEVLRAHDVLVVIGTEKGIAGVEQIIEKG